MLKTLVILCARGLVSSPSIICFFLLLPSSLLVTHSTRRRSSSSSRIQTWICHLSLFWALKLKANSETLAPRLLILTPLPSHNRYTLIMDLHVCLCRFAFNIQYVWHYIPCFPFSDEQHFQHQSEYNSRCTWKPCEHYSESKDINILMHHILYITHFFCIINISHDFFYPPTNHFFCF